MGLWLLEYRNAIVLWNEAWILLLSISCKWYVLLFLNIVYAIYVIFLCFLLGCVSRG